MKNRQLGGEIRSARKAKRMTQAQLAQLCGIATSEVSEIETGAQPRIVKREAALKMADALGISRVHLLRLGRPEEWRFWERVFRAEVTL